MSKPSPTPIKPGCIIILRGPSSVGKTTICNKVIGQNSQLPEAEKLDWLIDGPDLYAQRNRTGGEPIENAIAHAKQGKPAILDLGLFPIELVENFEKRLQQETAPIPNFVALVYLPIDEIARRLKERNDRATDLQDTRPNASAFILRGLPEMFTAEHRLNRNTTPPKYVDRLTWEQVENSLKILNPRASIQDSLDLAVAFGMGMEANPVKLYANVRRCDEIFKPTSYEEAGRIAARIREVALEKRRGTMTNTSPLTNNSNSQSK